MVSYSALTVDRHTARDGSQSTEIPSLSFSIYSAPRHFTGIGVLCRDSKDTTDTIIDT